MFDLRLGGAGPGPALGCGTLLVLLGIILISPVGAFLITTLGWVTAVAGVVLIVLGILSWLSGNRRDRR